jgi:hypothetical protein
VSDASLAKPHDIAAGEIDGWRGRCLDLFARGERAIALSREAAAERNASVTIRHLGGQRPADLAKLVNEDTQATAKQSKTLLSSLDAWLAVEGRRAFFAHGVVTALLDRHGAWHAKLDFTKYQASKRERQSWTCDRQEALQFEADLEREFKQLSTQLGQFRKRLVP